MSAFPETYRRNLPHIQRYGSLLFLTYRLNGSLPADVLEQLEKERKENEDRLAQSQTDPSRHQALRDKIRRRIYVKFDEALNRGDSGPTWLSEPAIARLLKEAILYRHPGQYDLVCFSIMPNHVHQIVVNRPAQVPMYQTIGELKSFTAKKANKILGRRGTFWQRESFDHVIRPGRLAKTILYVLDNPVQAGLVSHWSAWPYSWLNPRFGGDLVSDLR